VNNVMAINKETSSGIVCDGGKRTRTKTIFSAAARPLPPPEPGAGHDGCPATPGHHSKQRQPASKHIIRHDDFLATLPADHYAPSGRTNSVPGRYFSLNIQRNLMIPHQLAGSQSW
jgi:hypothetical protein